jgi:hypothetical protein
MSEIKQYPVPTEVDKRPGRKDREVPRSQKELDDAFKEDVRAPWKKRDLEGNIRDDGDDDPLDRW